MYQFFAYLRFLWRSTNQHGVHSPFVFGLVTRCFYDGKKRASYEVLDRYRKELLADSRDISVSDFGAGSRVFKSEKRRISDIAKNAGISRKQGRLMNRLANYLQAQQALELGTSVGLGSMAMAEGNNVKITSLEGCPSTSGVAKEYFVKFKQDSITVMTGEFKQVLKCQELQDTSYDLIFFDGNHQKQPTLDYFHSLLPTAHNNSVFIFDDIYWSQEMTDAWEEIKDHPSVRVSIDLFFWGLVFFRKEQRKEHFTIRV